MIKGIQHIGVGVKDIEKTLAALSEVLGVPVPPIKEVPDRQARVAMLQLGPIALEIVQDDSENGQLGRFVREKGDGIHHFCVTTDDIEADVASLKARGVQMNNPEPRIGLRGKKIAFISPNSLAGLFCELSEP